MPQREELVERAPVRRCRAPVEQACVGVDERTGAAAARVDEHVDLAELVPRRLREHLHAFRARHRLAVVADEQELDLVGVEEPPGGEHLPGAGEVELLGAVEDGDRDPYAVPTPWARR